MIKSKIFLFFVVLGFILGSVELYGEVFLITELDLNPRNSSLRHSDIAFSAYHSSIFSNPAAISELDIISTGLTYSKNFADVSLTSLSVIYPLKNKFGTAGFSLAYLDLGEFEDIENDYSTYTAYEMMITGSYGYNIYEHVHIGSNLRFLQSKIDTYSSNAVSIDLTGLYLLMDDKLRFATGIYNFGTQISKFNDDISEDLPMEFRGGVSNRLDRIPLEVGVQYSYSFNNVSTYGVGVEFIPKDNFKIRAGYDFSADDRKFGTGEKLEKFAGIALGAEIDIMNFGFDFSYSVDGELENKFSLATTYYFKLKKKEIDKEGNNNKVKIESDEEINKREKKEEEEDSIKKKNKKKRRKRGM